MELIPKMIYAFEGQKSLQGFLSNMALTSAVASQLLGRFSQFNPVGCFLNTLGLQQRI